MTLIERLRDTPNWLRQESSGWDSVSMLYDRAPFEAADEIGRLRAAVASALEFVEAEYGDHECGTHRRNHIRMLREALGLPAQEKS